MRLAHIFLLLFFSVISPLAGSQAPTLRVIILCDPLSKNIRDGTGADQKRVKRSFLNIANILHVQSKISVIHKKSFSTKAVKRWIKKLPANSNDITVFYFSGHGGRIERMKLPWPFIIFPKGPSQKSEKCILGDQICTALAAKKNKLSLVLFDACNSLVQIKSPISHGELFADKKGLVKGLSKLFLQTRGQIIGAAASPGEVAITFDGGPNIGSVFTTGFLYSLQESARTSDPSWDQIAKQTVHACARFHNGKQHPYFDLQLK